MRMIYPGTCKLLFGGHAKLQINTKQGEFQKRKTSKQIKVCQNKIQSHSNATSDQVEFFRIALRELHPYTL